MKYKKIIILLLTLSSCINSSTYYSINEDKLYFKTWNEAHGKELHLVEGVDINTFQELENKYGKDKNHIYYEGVAIANSEPNSFKFLKNGYAIDSNQGYYYGKPFKSKLSLANIEKPYAKDDSNVYYQGRILEKCNPNTFEILSRDEFSIHNWSTDGKYYFYNSFKIESHNYTDIVYFKNSEFAKDKEYVYCLGKRFNYKNGIKLFDIDVASFGVNGNGDYFDKGGVFTFYSRKNK